jgi:hypothetical protein
MWFIGSQLVFIALGLLPLPLWRSFRPGEKAPPEMGGQAPQSATT